MPKPQGFSNATRTVSDAHMARAQWDQAASGWHQYASTIRTWLGDATAAMIDMAHIKPGSRVLDVAAGAGDQTLDIAAQVGTDGFVLATDLSAAMLQFAQENLRHAGYRNFSTRVADGQHLKVRPASFDAAVCRLGLMFFPDPLQGLREIHRALKPGGGVCTMVFSRPEANPCVTILMSTACRHAGLPPRDPYEPGGVLSLGKPNLIDDLFREAGFKDIATTRLDSPLKLPSARDYLNFIQASAGPIKQILSQLHPVAAHATWTEMEQRLNVFQTDAGWQGPNELLLTAARR